MPLPILLLGALGVGAVCLLNEGNKSDVPNEDENPEKDTVNPLIGIEAEEQLETVAESDAIPYIENETVDNPITLKRGDRFTCPETGEQL